MRAATRGERRRPTRCGAVKKARSPEAQASVTNALLGRLYECASTSIWGFPITLQRLSSQIAVGMAFVVITYESKERNNRINLRIGKAFEPGEVVVGSLG